MRVTFQSTFRNGLFDVNQAAERYADKSQQVSSGKRMQSAADDPGAFSGGIRERTEMATLDTFISSGDNANSRLSVADSVLSDFIKEIESAQSAGAAGRSTVLTQPQRDATALQIRGLRDSMMQSLNTQYQGIYLFSGAQSNTQPYSAGPPVSAYQGDANVQSVDVARGRAVQVTWDGSQIVQGSAPTDVFTTLTNLANAVQTGNMTSIDAALLDVNKAHDRATAVQSTIGADIAGLAVDRDRLDSLRRAADTRRSHFEDANMAESISGAAQGQQAYQAALAALGKAGQLSLLDYLK
jgi:flagellar hook-associated protein 3 FlgL